jgi:hypothetical protein
VMSLVALISIASDEYIAVDGTDGTVLRFGLRVKSVFFSMDQTRMRQETKGMASV